MATLHLKDPRHPNKLGHYCSSVAFSPPKDDYQASHVLAAGLYGYIELYDPVSGSLLHKLHGHSQRVRSVAFSPDGSLLASGSDDVTVQLWDMQTKQRLAVLEGHTSFVFCVAFSPCDGGRLLASGSWDKAVRLWDTQTKQCVAVLEGHTSCVYSVAFSPDGSLLASSAHDHTVRLWNMPEGAPGPVLVHTNNVFRVSFSPLANTNLLASGCLDGTISLWDVSGALNGGEATLVWELQGHACVLCVAFSSDGKQLASGSEDSTVRLWSVASGALLKTLEEHENRVNSVAFHPSGHQLASASDDRTICIRTVCEWSDRRHHLFGQEIKRIVFVLMCVKQRQENNDVVVRLPMQLWLDIFTQLSYLVHD